MKLASVWTRLKAIGLKKVISFHLIAWVGTLVNLAFLWLTHGVLKVPLMIAGVIAIEVAIIHNFTGHYFITWKHSVRHSLKNYFLLLFKYNLIIASIDFVVNLGILGLLTHFFGVHYLIANLTGQILGPVFKLLANEFLVFRNLKHHDASLIPEDQIKEIL